jgi:hypothetical protein
MDNKQIRFTVRNKGGKLGGQTIEHKVPGFDWVSFRKMPNAEAFVKKAYFAAAHKICREIYEGINGTDEHHLQSVDSLIARSINLTQKEIKDWLDSRDWTHAKFNINKEKAIDFLEKNLPLLANNESAFPEKLRERAAEIVAEIAEIADYEADPIADYLWVKLTQESANDELLSLL